MATTTKPSAPARRGDPAEFRRVQDLSRERNVQVVDVKFTDLPGTWQHYSVPPSAMDADALNEGIGFDGSSIRGFQEIQESDMLVMPEPTSAFLDPSTPAATLVLICNITRSGHR
jgi:glutamine synthetase